MSDLQADNREYARQEQIWAAMYGLGEAWRRLVRCPQRLGQRVKVLASDVKPSTSDRLIPGNVSIISVRSSRS